MSCALELADRAWRAAEGDEVDAIAHVENSGLARFASSDVHQPTLIRDGSVTLRVVRDGRVGTSYTNRTDDEGLHAAASRAGAAADSAPPDRGWPGLPAPAPIADVDGYDQATAALTAEDQAQLAWSAIASVSDLRLFGYFTSGVTETAVASSNGVAVSQSMTDASVLALAASDEASGYAEASSWRASDIDPLAVADEAAEKARQTEGAIDIEPGTYRAVLEPYAFSELLFSFALTSLSGLAFLEARSFLTDRLGDAIFHPSLSILDDGLDPRGYPKAFDFEGVPKQPVVMIEDGVAKDVVWDRRTALRAGNGKASTGHALSPPAQSFGPIAFNIKVPGGDADLPELIERVGSGLYITRLHYLGIVDPRDGIITGMTRDGTFRIEGGRVKGPLVNLRFTLSFPEFARRLVGLTRELTLVNRSDYYNERYPHGTLVPAVATEAFTVVGTGSRPGL